MNIKFKKRIVGTLLAAVCTLSAGAAFAAYNSETKVETHWRYYDSYGYVTGGGSYDCNGKLSTYGIKTSTVRSTIKVCR